MKFLAYILMLCVLLVGSGKVLHIHTCCTTGEKTISFFRAQKCGSNYVATGAEEEYSCEKSCCHPTKNNQEEEQNLCDDVSLEILLDLKKDGDTEPTKVPDFSVVYTLTLDSFTQVEISFTQDVDLLNKPPPLPETSAEKLQRWII